jgi:cytoskeletal protein CcmA (bactofilin family)
MASTLKFFTRGEGPDWTGFLDREARVEGTLEVPGTFRIDGTLRGRIVSNHALVLGETADVEGEIEGVRVEIFGQFRGTLRASERVQIHSGAAVTGDLYTPCLVLEPGGRFDGQCYLNQGGEPAEALLVPIRANALEEKPEGSSKG